MQRAVTRGRAAGPRRKRGEYAKSAETRERILTAAAAVAGEVGVHAVSVARIAERAGVAVGNLHYHFGSLDELMRVVMQHVADWLTSEILQAIESGGDVFAREEAAFRAYLAFVRRNPTYVRLAEEARVHHPEIYHSVLKTWLDLFGENLRDGIASGEVRPMSDQELHALTHYLIGARYFVDQMIQGLHGQTYPGDDAVVASYMNFVRCGLAADPQAARAANGAAPGPGAGRAT